MAVVFINGYWFMYFSVLLHTGPKQIYTRTALFWFGPNSFGLDCEFSAYFKFLAFVLKRFDEVQMFLNQSKMILDQ
jgi:hypothetical protein